MKTIEYCPDGIAFADAKAEDEVKKFYDSDATEIKVSTENFILATRARIKEGHILHTEITILFEDMELYIDAEGRLANWPAGFCDYWDRWLDRILWKAP